MQLARMIALVVATSAVLAACGGPEAANGPDTKQTAMKGDDALIASAQKISDAIGGCGPADAMGESKVVGLENGAIVMIACSQGDGFTAHRLFLVQGTGGPTLLSLPDYTTSGWVAGDKARMAEIDAGTGVLTTLRKGDKEGCGSEGRYQWDGARFVLQEMRWQSCDDPGLKGPPFPVVWPTQVGAAVDPNGATPAP
ncbi:MAG: hypothetical protein ABMA14_27745 [Hyphomonadaceae bacterium]